MFVILTNFILVEKCFSKGWWFNDNGFKGYGSLDCNSNADRLYVTDTTAINSVNNHDDDTNGDYFFIFFSLRTVFIWSYFKLKFAKVKLKH